MTRLLHNMMTGVLERAQWDFEGKFETMFSTLYFWTREANLSQKSVVAFQKT